jgi:hypothetical protein
VGDRGAGLGALAARMMVLETDRLLPQVTTQGAGAFAMVVTASTTILRNMMRGQDMAEATDFAARVEVACRVIHSLILQPVSAVDLESEDALKAFARNYIAPILFPQRSPAPTRPHARENRRRTSRAGNQQQKNSATTRG